ncbi:hypothetical protein RQP53_23360 [Paucibacter sp. APW11]|uniref:Uncharacterized protein n=1 Tax=Roseateles aquae TaxID=3077235 RepID=A0ABU3PI79_9BURK|nr:hypothetical protein [Paucibacter sp. APW11]MDT9002238.1 hypothetical protein [Paucibacter sp. APW11]
MSNISAATLRACLKAFLGEQEYRRFLEAGAADPMKFWQERSWEKFVTEHPEMAMRSDERASALDVCPAHEAPLMAGFTDSPEGHTFMNTPEMRHVFPCAPLMPLLPAGVYRVKYCQQCISAKAEYFASRKQQNGARA